MYLTAREVTPTPPLLTVYRSFVKESMSELYAAHLLGHATASTQRRPQRAGRDVSDVFESERAFDRAKGFRIHRMYRGGRYSDHTHWYPSLCAVRPATVAVGPVYSDRGPGPS